MKVRKIFSIIAIAALLIATVVTIAIAAGSEPTAEIMFKNVEFGGNLKLMYAVKSENLSTGDEVRVVVCDANGKVIENTVKGEPAKINGINCDVFTSERGVPAQSIDEVVYARAEIVNDGEIVYQSALMPYSVLEYVWVRMDNETLSKTERDMFLELISYASLTDAFFNGTPEGERIGDYVYVSIEGGTLDGAKSSGFYLPGTVLNKISANDKNGTYSVKEFSQDGSCISALTYSVADKASVTVGTGRMKISVLQPTKLPHVDYSDSNGNSYNKELFYMNDYDIALGDPTVLPVVENGVTWFYVTGTKSGSDFQLFKTRDFTDWLSLGTVYTPPKNFFGKSSFWAPQLMYDAEADWKYYLGEGAGEGKGLYILFFSARGADDICMLSVAFSKSVTGPYTNFVGTNANGDYIDETHSCFELDKLKGLGLYENTAYGPLYKAGRGFIDASPYVDPVRGDKYLYMVRNRAADTSNDVWGVKMKDWVTPDYATTAPLSSYGYTTIEKNEAYGYKSKNNIDEGPFVYYKDVTDDGVDNGKYYLTLSIGDTNDKLYPVCQAVSDSPLGPFTKIQPDENGFVICPGDLWDIHGSGHHCFFEAEGELFVAYHTYVIKSGSSIGSRYFAFSKVEWIENEDGLALMRANGPHKTVQPLPKSASKYENLMDGATVTVDGNFKNADVLNDGLIALSDDDFAKECYLKGDGVITIDFDGCVSLRAIAFYNSYDYLKAFNMIDRIEFSYCTVNGGKLQRGIAVIDKLGFDFTTHLIPAEYLAAKGASGEVMRPMGTSIAEFDEIDVETVTIYLSPAYNRNELAISEIIVLGKKSSIDPSKYSYGGVVSKEFEPYTDFVPVPSANVKIDEYITLDGVLDEPIWQSADGVFDIAGATKDQSDGNKPIDVSIWGERSAKVYTHMSDTTIYFAFDVKDPNLFYNASNPQGRSTCVEIYLAPAGMTTFTPGCYSIRINPTGEMNGTGFRLGTYVPNDTLSEWGAKELGGALSVAVKVNGTVVNTANGVSDPNNVGYVVEVAISRALVASEADAFRFTAAFVQDKGYNLNRLGNTFIENSHYMRPATWIVVEPNGKAVKVNEEN